MEQGVLVSCVRIMCDLLCGLALLTLGLGCGRSLPETGPYGYSSGVPGSGYVPPGTIITPATPSPPVYPQASLVPIPTPDPNAGRLRSETGQYLWLTEDEITNGESNGDPVDAKKGENLTDGTWRTIGVWPEWCDTDEFIWNDHSEANISCVNGLGGIAFLTYDKTICRDHVTDNFFDPRKPNFKMEAFTVCDKKNKTFTVKIKPGVPFAVGVYYSPKCKYTNPKDEEERNATTGASLCVSPGDTCTKHVVPSKPEIDCSGSSDTMPPG